MSKLLIVESPTKVKSIKKYLGGEFDVMASMGHVRDLPKSKIGVDIENGFKPQYINMTEKKSLIDKLKTAAANSDEVYLATDPDREGEAISWHLAQILALDLKAKNRVTFNEITKSGVLAGISKPRSLDMNLIDSQQARRVLDRIVGYKLSPLLWKKVKSGLSAGRVQTVALRLIVEREREIEKFVSEEFWSVDAKLVASRKNFCAKLYGDKNGKIETIPNEEAANAILKNLENVEYKVSSIKKGKRNRQPAPPFITSTLQQEAARKIGFTAQRTMRVAQQLYEGIDVRGMGTTGLITYMRTDSLRISEEARAEANSYILNTYGNKYLPSSPRYFKSKNKEKPKYMDLVGKKVRHKVFGSGTISAFDPATAEKESGYVTVEFATKEAKFLYPDAFGKFIVLEDEEALAKIENEQKAKEKEQNIAKIKEALKLKAEKAEQEAQKAKAKAAPKTIDDYFGADYHAEKLKREPILTYRQVEGSFGIRLGASGGKDINSTEMNVVLISSINKIGGKFVYKDRWTEEGDYIYSGEGKIGDQRMEGGNLAIETAAEERKDIHLFVKISPMEYYYQGIFTLAEETLEEGKDENGNFRMEYKFRLTPKK